MATNHHNNEPPKELFVPHERKEDTSEQISKPSRSFFQDARRTFFKNKAAVLSVILMIIIIIMSIIGPYFNDYGMDDQDLSRAKMPPRAPVLENVPFLGLEGTLQSNFRGETVEEATENAVMRYDNAEEYIDINVLSEGDGSDDSAEVEATYNIYEAKDMQDQYFWLGTDQLGRDQWTRIWLGTRVSLIIAFVAAAIDLLIGVAYGGISGYYGGRVDNIMQRILEILIGIPNLVVIFLLLVVLEPGIMSIVLALTITGWTGMARIVRGEVLKQKNEEYVLAARTLGQSNGKIIRKHLMPNVAGIIIINTMFTIPSAIFFEAFLSFIGLGIAPPEASLGALIDAGFKVFRLYPYMVLWPAILISVIMITFNLIGDGLRDAFDPKMHK
ncbi:oligopeptide transport system permease protein [Lentibacillus persicus]|uniref:Oligopeptide transport system permease protein n=1 Tax=Lentibacillus persicus TaxID=640948 RepID=A0A1I1U3W5_9BACI|nr:oligopeptide ABC transporter permease [Lentibacillus persicus]SFD65536.1 oligopeptide transport system permease protein [Lentibacillus persicus]